MEESIEGYWVVSEDSTGDNYIVLVVEDYEEFDAPVIYFHGDETPYDLEGYELECPIEI